MLFAVPWVLGIIAAAGVYAAGLARARGRHPRECDGRCPRSKRRWAFIAEVEGRLDTFSP